MKIILDENIEFGKDAFQHIGEVNLVHGRKITNDLLKDVEILVVRSITNVNKDLLKDTPVKFVGSTTIGTDHLDKEFLTSAGIEFTAAPGCNAYAVTEYITTAISMIASKQNFALDEKTLGVVGYGNIGKKVTRFAETLGMTVLVNDPPLEREGFDYNFSSLEDVLNCDIITMHVPMNKSGVDKTYHLIDEARIGKLKPGTVLINSSRGAVVDNSALLDRVENSKDLIVVLDVWENEPAVNQSLLEKVYLGTPHIAGYTYEGKVNGTVMIYNALCEFLNVEKTWKPDLLKVSNKNITLNEKLGFTNLLYNVTNQIYSISEDSEILKQRNKLDINEFAVEFDKLRKNYNLRREFNNFNISSSFLSEKDEAKLKQLRFNIL